MRTAIRHDRSLHRHAQRVAPLGFLGLAGALALAACGEAPQQFPAGPLVTTTSSAPVTTTSMCAHLPPEQGGCGLTCEEQRRLNQRYAERLPFRGRSEEAAAIADEVRVALRRFSGRATDPGGFGRLPPSEARGLGRDRFSHHTNGGPDPPA